MPEKKDGNGLHLKKYANRRYYDAANSRHLKLQEIHELVKNGRSIRVTDGQSGKDITSEVLLGILLEFEPEKAASIPGSILASWIQAETKNLRDVAADTAHPLWKAISDFRQQLQSEVKKSEAMREIIPAVKGLAEAIATPFKETIAPVRPASTKSDKPEPAQNSRNEDLEELIRAYDAGEFKAT